jgi:hypothetical protein
MIQPGPEFRGWPVKRQPEGRPRRLFVATPWARGLLFWGVLVALFANGLRPMNADSLVSFTPFVLLYGSVTYRLWCRRLIVGWSRSAPSTLPTVQPT